MFGYVKPDYKELKVKEYDLYKSTYCGLCRVMGKKYSYVYKMSLSYDFVFMVLLRLYASPEKVSFVQKRCIAHPTRKKTMMEKNEALELSADVGVIMLYHDFLDKIRDGDGLKSLSCRLLMPELRRLRKKACKNPQIKAFDEYAENSIKRLSEIEKSGSDSVDMPAEEFGSLLGEALSVGYDGAKKLTVFEIGKNVGKWIYIADAVDDVDRDAKKGSYNPLLSAFGEVEAVKNRYEMIDTTLLNILYRADGALGLLDNTDEGIYNILTNIIRLGNVGIHRELLTKNKFNKGGEKQ